MSDVKNSRNQYGIKDQIDCYRTVDGERYVSWDSDFSQEDVAAYRRAGVRCRQFAGELYVHKDDQGMAGKVSEGLRS